MKNMVPGHSDHAQDSAVIYAFVFAVISAIAAVFGLLDISTATAVVVKAICGVAFMLCVGFFVLAKFTSSDAMTE